MTTLETLEIFFPTKKHMGMLLIILTFILSVPFTLTILAQKNNKTVITSKTAQSIEMGGPFGTDPNGQPIGYVCNGGNCNFSGNQNNTNPQNGNGQIIYGNNWPQTPAGYIPPNGQIQQGNQIPQTNQSQNANQNTAPQTSNQVGSQTASAANVDNCTPGAGEDQWNSQEVAMFNLVNQYRQSLGLGQVAGSAKLSRVAAWMAGDMLSHNNFSHTDTLGRYVDVRASQCGIAVKVEETNGHAEGISDDATAIFNGFKGSPQHNAIMTNPAAAQVGVGRAISNGSVYWALEYGQGNDGTSAVIAPPDPTPQPTTPATTPGACSCVVQNRTYACGETTADTCPAGSGIAYMCQNINGQAQWVQSTVACTGDPNTTPVPSGPVATPTPSVGKSMLTLQIPGIGTKPGQNHKPLQTSIQGELIITDSSGQDHPLSPAFAFKNFVFSLSADNMPPGDYIYRLRIPNSLWVEGGPITITAGKTTNLTIPMAMGDINGDNSLDLSDYNTIISCYGQNSCTQKTQADLNLDGKVDEVDLNILFAGLSKRSGD